ncbi:MAG TPA: aminotransferase class I/II-fold pyridoxal phosphate-dependent enzyme, partial [Opitutaceae bacterium]|nr:aminotransferase class I/II-fold pyridoxal phosphate-dependent enzyme [Opitutaceae bacterium]
DPAARRLAPHPEAARRRFHLPARWRTALDSRRAAHLLRQIRVRDTACDQLNLADNDYLDLARDPAVIAAAADSLRHHGTSAAASPLITGWKSTHETLVQTLCGWLGFSHGLLWTSGYAANSAVLGTLPEKGDLIFADRLIHASMVAGLVRSGARFKRYPHLDLDRLELELSQAPSDAGTAFVVTETIFSMDGDYPDLRRLARLKRDYRFILIVDEAHGLGWYGPTGSGLVAECGIAEDVDVLVGTLGKTLGSGGAFTLFRNKDLRDYLVNHAGEFIYSTALPPPAAAAALAAIGRIRELAAGQRAWREQSSRFRAQLRAAGWNAPPGDSPIVPVPLGDEAAALRAARALRGEGILAAAVRPPTVPAGTSRLRFSLKRTFEAAAAKRVLDALDGVRPRRLRCAWVLGWAVPPDWFRELVRAVFPEAEHHLIAANAAFRAELERVGPCDLIAGYSLGSFLLLGAANDGWTPAAGTVALLAPIWRFPDRAGLRALRRLLASDPAAALAGFYRSAGLPDAAQFPPPPLEDLAWGLDQLERPGWDVRLPPGWRALVGSGDRLLKETGLKEQVPELQVVSGDHHPKPLLEALKRTLAAGGLRSLPNEAAR